MYSVVIYDTGVPNKETAECIYTGSVHISFITLEKCDLLIGRTRFIWWQVSGTFTIADGYGGITGEDGV